VVLWAMRAVLFRGAAENDHAVQTATLRMSIVSWNWKEQHKNRGRDHLRPSPPLFLPISPSTLTWPLEAGIDVFESASRPLSLSMELLMDEEAIYSLRTTRPQRMRLGNQLVLLERAVRIQRALL
jgi:hypothetical protein